MSQVAQAIQLHNFCYGCQKYQVPQDQAEAPLNDMAGNKVGTVVKLMACVRCHIAHYCSKECQKNDWNNHKVNCIENHTAFYGMELSTLFNTIQRLFTNTAVCRTLEGLSFGFGRLILELDGEHNFIEQADGTYQTKDSKIYMDFKAMIPNDISNERASASRDPKKIEYLEQLHRLARSHQDRFIVNVSIRGIEQVGNFQLRVARVS